MPEGIPYGVPGKTPQNPDPTIDNWLRNLLGGEPEGGDPTSGLGILPQSPMQGSPASGQLRGMQVGQIPEDMNTPPPLPLPVTAPPPSILPPIPGIDPIAEEPGAIDALAFEDLRGAGAGMESILANPPAAAQPQQAAAQPATQPAAATVQQEPPPRIPVPPGPQAPTSVPPTTPAPVEAILDTLSGGAGEVAKGAFKVPEAVSRTLVDWFMRGGPGKEARQGDITRRAGMLDKLVGDRKLGGSIYDAFLEETPPASPASMEGVAEGEDFDPGAIRQSIPEQTSFTSPLGEAPPEQTSFTSPLVPEGVTTIEPEEGQSPIDALIEKLGLLEMGDNERVVAMEGIPISIRVELLERIEEILESANIGDNIQ
jgi:hypothetical protein